jgi:uncharacterized protein YprB with RNaseH-like and TPR domain
VIPTTEILAAIKRHGSQRKAAAALGLHSRTVERRLAAMNDSAAIGGPRVLFVDIETAPVRAAVWGLWQQNVGLEMIDADWHLLSYSAKWLGEDRVFYDDQSRAADIEDDTTLLEQLHALLDEADVVIAHNGRRFDVPKIRARLLIKGFKPPRPFKIIDTLDVAKKQFGFTSNKLAWLSEILLENKKEEHKEFPGFKLWAECLKGNRRAWREMKTYNVQDTIALEELYLKFRPWIPHHLNVGVYGDHSERACSRCGSHDLQLIGTAPTNVNVYPLYECKACGGHSRGRQTMVTPKSRTTLLVAA